uniref:Ig-like domain-containing protein n=1 Tax=Pundamilia nyererei TaxID=303518 RepID=A0A3B4HB24_9CICH
MTKNSNVKGNKQNKLVNHSVIIVLCPLTSLLCVSGQEVTLTCRAPNNNIKGVVWSRADLGDKHVLVYREGQPLEDQHPFFKNRVNLQDRQMKDGDVSLILKDVTIKDAGAYMCHVFMEETDSLNCFLVADVLQHIVAWSLSDCQLWPVECWSTPLQWLCEVVGYSWELVHAVVYAGQAHPEHAQWVTCPVSMLAMQELGHSQLPSALNNVNHDSSVKRTPLQRARRHRM